jgi:hypothetical protein
MTVHPCEATCRRSSTSRANPQIAGASQEETMMGPMYYGSVGSLRSKPAIGNYIVKGKDCLKGSF